MISNNAITLKTFLRYPELNPTQVLAQRRVLYRLGTHYSADLDAAPTTQNVRLDPKACRDGFF